MCVCVSSFEISMKSHSKNISPVGWYYGSYLVRSVEIEESGNDDLESKFLVWVNTVIVKATDLSEAYDKIETIGKEHEVRYEAGRDKIPVKWVYEGIIELLPIYEELEDGAEIAFTEYKSTKLKKLRKLVRNKDDFYQ